MFDVLHNNNNFDSIHYNIQLWIKAYRIQLNLWHFAILNTLA